MGLDDVQRDVVAMRSRLPVVLAVLGFCAIVGGLAWTAQGDRGASAGSGDAPSARRLQDQEVAASRQLAPSTPAEVTAGGVALPSGSGEVAGHPTGFPYSDLGAAAVPVAIARAQVGFDRAQAEAVATTYAMPTQQRTFVLRARAAVAARRQQTGVPAQGSAPAPAAYAATPVAFTVAELEPNFYAVNVLSYLTVTSVRGESLDSYYAGAQLVRWVPDSSLAAGGDWKLDVGTPSDQQQLAGGHAKAAAAPGTVAFEAEGWLLLEPSGASS